MWDKRVRIYGTSEISNNHLVIAQFIRKALKIYYYFSLFLLLAVN